MRRAASAAAAAAVATAAAAGRTSAPVAAALQWCLPPAACAASGRSVSGFEPHRLWGPQQQQQLRAHTGSSGGSSGEKRGGAPDAASLAARLALMDAIHLKGLMFHGFHGVLPEETTLGQKFLVDATLYCGPSGLAPAGASDDLNDSINYAAVYEDIQSIMEGPPFKLLEAAAAAIAGRLLEKEQRVRAVRVHVRKPHVALRGPLESVGIEIFRAREG